MDQSWGAPASARPCILAGGGGGPPWEVTQQGGVSGGEVVPLALTCSPRRGSGRAHVTGVTGDTVITGITRVMGASGVAGVATGVSEVTSGCESTMGASEQGGTVANDTVAEQLSRVFPLDSRFGDAI